MSVIIQVKDAFHSLIRESQRDLTNASLKHRLLLSLFRGVRGSGRGWDISLWKRWPLISENDTHAPTLCTVNLTVPNFIVGVYIWLLYAEALVF